MQDQARQALEQGRAGLQEAVDRIPPDAWPLIDLMFKITIALAILWLALASLAWWRRRAYNLTVASTARHNKKAQPDFLNVDKKARERAIDRGEAHSQALDEREEDDALAALKAAKEPLTIASRIAALATGLMSLFTLITGFTGAILNVSRVGDYLEQASVGDRLSYLIHEHPFGCAVVTFVISFHIWRYVAEKKWKKA